MKTLIFANPSESELETAASSIRNGGIVVFPTETVYGLGGNALATGAAAKIYAAKGRPSDNPLIVHLANYKDSEKYCYTDDTFYKLAETFMPGPITIIMKKRDCIPLEVTGGLDTVAIRVPSNPIAHRLIELSGVPIAAPSANISGKPSPTKLEHVVLDMDGKADVILGGGECTIGLESTIVRHESDGTLSLLRPGGITIEMLRDAMPGTEVNDISFRKLKDGEAPPAPGMKYRHYAPNADVIILSGSREDIMAFMLGKCENKDTGFICPLEWRGKLGKNAISYGSEQSADESEMAHNLFDILRKFDKKPEIKTIYADMPQKEGIGAAVYNRLVKAAGFRILDVRR